MLSAAEHANSIMDPTWQRSIISNRPRRWNTDPIESMIRWPAGPMQNMHDKVDCRNVDMFLHFPLPPRHSRLPLGNDFTGSPPCVDSRQHFFCVLWSDQRHSLVRRGLRFSTNVWEHREQWEDAPQNGIVSRRSAFVTEYQQFVKNPWPTASRIFHNVFIVKHISPRVQNLLCHESTPREIHQLRKYAEVAMR